MLVRLCFLGLLLVSVMMVRGFGQQAIAQPVISATRIVPARPTTSSSFIPPPVAATAQVVMNSADGTQPSETPTTNQWVALIVSQPLIRRASDVMRGKLLGPRQAFANPSPDAEGEPAKLGPPPGLNLPTPEAYAAFKKRVETWELQRRATRFRDDFVLGNWPEVAQVLKGLPEEQAMRIFDHALMSLSQPITPQTTTASTASPTPQAVSAAELEMSFLTPEDVLAISDWSPTEPNELQIAQLAQLLATAMGRGYSDESVMAQLEQGTRWLGGKDVGHRIQAAELLSLAGLNDDAGKLLPPFDSLDRSNAKLLLAYAEHAQRMFTADRKQDFRQQAWQCYQALLDLPSASRQDKLHALEQLIQLSTKVEKETGGGWLEVALASGSARGKNIVALLGDKSLDGLTADPYDPDRRLEWLKLQNHAIETFLSDRTDADQGLSDVLSLLAISWLKESQLCINQAQYSMGNAYMRLDMYGNYYWVDPNEEMRRMNQGRQPQPIQIHELLECRPNEQWSARVAADLQLAIPKMLVHLYLRADEEDKAFPYIEQIATRDAESVQALVDEFMDAWKRNHDPNNNRRMQNRYIYLYGFDQKADAIPLTRSKQQRNIAELSQWVQRIRKLPIKELDETKLADAFTTCHSSAEVFQLSAIESVFGAIESLKPETVASLAQTMRTNLATVWRSVKQQETLQTHRREPEIQQEVVRGYATAREFVSRALDKQPDNWRLQMTLACLEHDENDYAQSIKKSSDFSARREAAFDRFAHAAQLYADVVTTLDKEKQTTDVYDYWFYSSLGAVDLGRITAESVPDQKQYARIRQAILDLPGELAQDHMAKFANNLFTRMSPLKPELKYRYLKGGFEIAGDHPRAIEARKLFQYYNDLITEIKLVAEIDGSDVVGHTRPFGVYLDIMHTPEIERESAGFSKYVQNQNNMNFAYNYGRPTEDYRDKFEKNVREAFSEHFEVQSIAFEDPKNMHSRETEQPGWRVTPYAYVVLKPLGPQVDKLPPVQLDLDFLDTSGYAVIPISTPIIPIDSSPNRVPPRPYSELKITQTLDERQAADGKLILEIKGTAKGLVPELDDVLDLHFDKFDVKSVDSQPVLPSGFDPKSEAIVVDSDRSWTVELAPKDKAAGNPKQFTFASAKSNDITNEFQRYNDADLVAVEQTVDLERSYRHASVPLWVWFAIPLGLIGLLAVVYLALASKPSADANQRVAMPEDVNPFTVLSLLKRIRSENGIAERHQGDLNRSIEELEQYFFAPSNGHVSPDLESIARTWVGKAR